MLALLGSFVCLCSFQVSRFMKARLTSNPRLGKGWENEPRSKKLRSKGNKEGRPSHSAPAGIARPSTGPRGQTQQRAAEHQAKPRDLLLLVSESMARPERPTRGRVEQRVAEHSLLKPSGPVFQRAEFVLLIMLLAGFRMCYLRLWGHDFRDHITYLRFIF